MIHVTTLINRRCITAACVLAVGLGSACVAVGSQSPAQLEGYNAVTMRDDLAARSPDIHWPAGFEPAKADLFAHNDLTIDAPCEQVWGHIINAIQPASGLVWLCAGNPAEFLSLLVPAAKGRSMSCDYG